VKIYLANAAFKPAGYDFALTLEAAARAGFAGVQLYVNEANQRSRSMLARVGRRARDAGLDMLVHLPDTVTEATARAARLLLQFQRTPRALIHYRPGQPLPTIEGIRIGLENAVQGLDAAYYEQWTHACRRRGTFAVFDVPRLFGRRGVDLKTAQAFAHQALSRLRSTDVVHLIDQKHPGSRRADWCVLGRGLLRPLLPLLAAHAGPIVLEFENLSQAVASKAVLETSAALHSRRGSE
jgi:hypothetical protein